MYENPADELYFGEVYRTVLQEAWLPEGAEVWQRTGISRRGRRPTQQGLIAGTPTAEQAVIRQCFSRCVAAWNALPWANPPDTTCDNRWGKEYWKKDKDDRGLMCSYYDNYMKYCMRYCLDTQCVPPANYLLTVSPSLKNLTCSKVYDLNFPNKCGDVEMISGDGQFIPPSEWVSPKCGREGILCFMDANSSKGSTTYQFAPDYVCDEFLWDPANPKSIQQGQDKSISIIGGAPPFTWDCTGTGFNVTPYQTQLRTATLHAGPSACGAAFIEVTDVCGNIANGYVLCGAGNWVTCEEFYFHCWPTVLHEEFIGKWWVRWRCCTDWMSAGQGPKTVHCPEKSFTKSCPITINYLKAWEWRC